MAHETSHRRTWLRSLVCAAWIYVGAAFAAENLPLIPDNVSLLDNSLLWDRQILVRTGLGYKDNVLLSPFRPVGSGFFKSGLEATLLRLPTEGLHFVASVEGEDIRYFRSGTLDAEQSLLAMTQLKKDWGAGWQAGLTVEYAYVDQVQDISVSENVAARAKVQGHIISVHPALRRDWGTNWWTQMELSATRRLLAVPIDDDWNAGPKLTLGHSVSERSELRMSGGLLNWRYDTRVDTDATGAGIAGTHRERWIYKTDLTWQHYWDEARRWRSTTALAFDYNMENGAGYFDYRKYEVTEQLRYLARGWEARTRVELGYYEFPVRGISSSPSAKFHRTNLTVNLRAEKRVAKFLKIYGEFEHERSISNEAFEEYTVNTVLGGLEWEF